MRIVKQTLASLAFAGFLAAQPLAAQAAPVARTGASTEQAEELAGGSAVLVVLGVFVGLLLLAEVTGVIDVLGEDDAVSP